MSKVKIKNIKTGVIKMVEENIAGDFIGTKRFVIVKEEAKKTSEKTEKKLEENKHEY